jgi:hypothetical protein
MGQIAFRVLCGLLSPPYFLPHVPRAPEKMTHFLSIVDVIYSILVE